MIERKKNIDNFIRIVPISCCIEKMISESSDEMRCPLYLQLHSTCIVEGNLFFGAQPPQQNPFFVRPGQKASLCKLSDQKPVC